MANAGRDVLILDCDGVVVDSEHITKRVLGESHFDVSPCACLVIEDSTSGVAAAVAAGMRVYGFSQRTSEAALLAAGAGRVFHKMSDLPSLVAGLE